MCRYRGNQVEESRGANRAMPGAHALAQKLWAGEQYFLQLDAHLRLHPRLGQGFGIVAQLEAQNLPADTRDQTGL